MEKYCGLNPGDFRHSLANNNLVLGYRKKALNNQHCHNHRTYEIQLILSGERKMFVGKKTICLGKNDLLLIPPETIHKFTGGDRSSEIYWLTYGPDHDLAKLLGSSVLNMKLKLHDSRHITQLYQRMTDEFDRREKGYEQSLKCLADELLIYILRMPAESEVPADESRSEVNRKMMGIAEYIDRNYHRKLSLSHLSEEFFISPSYLSRSFRRETGFTLTEYINLTRVLKAKAELISTADSVSDICMRCGFGSFTNFGRIFKDLSGYSPGAFRRLS